MNHHPPVLPSLNYQDPRLRELMELDIADFLHEEVHSAMLTTEPRRALIVPGKDRIEWFLRAVERPAAGGMRDRCDCCGRACFVLLRALCYADLCLWCWEEEQR